VNVSRPGGNLLLRAAAASTAMTASQHLEMLVPKRPPSDLPVRVVEQLTRRRVAAGYPRVVVGHLAQANLAALAGHARRAFSPHSRGARGGVHRAVSGRRGCRARRRYRSGRNAVAVVTAGSWHRPDAQDITGSHRERVGEVAFSLTSTGRTTKMY
jgi:hypothetical protein